MFWLPGVLTHVSARLSGRNGWLTLHQSRCPAVVLRVVTALLENRGLNGELQHVVSGVVRVVQRDVKVAVAVGKRDRLKLFFFGRVIRSCRTVSTLLQVFPQDGRERPDLLIVVGQRPLQRDGFGSQPEDFGKQQHHQQNQRD